MPERDLHSLLDMLISARIALSYVSEKSQTEFLADSLVQDAVVLRIEIIGEAARRISEGTRTGLSQIPWRRIIGMRNRIIHEYERVDLDVVWDVVGNDLPALIAELEKIVPPEEE
jgi:uncharacterized protein with HEPN domain